MLNVSIHLAFRCRKVSEVGMKEAIIQYNDNPDADGGHLVISWKPLIRCKDCKHKEESVSPSWEAWCNRLHCGCDLDWFCADGVKRDNE